jgi:branched-chain amino acid transport system permease protein
MQATDSSAVAAPLLTARTSIHRRVVGLVGLVGGVAALAGLAPTVLDAGWLATATLTVVFTIVTAGVGLLHGQLGLTSLGQVTFAGIGAWTALRLHFATSLPFFGLLLGAGAITAVVASLLALPALRLRGLELALVTLLIAGGFDVAFNAAGFPNGGGGFFGYSASGELHRMPRPSIAISDPAYFRLTLAVAVVIYATTWMLLRGRLGRAWALMSAGDNAARSAGVRTVSHRILAFAYAGLISGIAGALLVTQVGQTAPATFAPLQSLLLFALVVVAGAYTWPGWVLAAILYQSVPYLLGRLGVDGNYATIFFGAVLMHTIITAPRGIVGNAAALRVPSRLLRSERS